MQKLCKKHAVISSITGGIKLCPEGAASDMPLLAAVVVNDMTHSLLEPWKSADMEKQGSFESVGIIVFLTEGCITYRLEVGHLFF